MKDISYSCAISTETIWSYCKQPNSGGLAKIWCYCHRNCIQVGLHWKRCRGVSRNLPRNPHVDLQSATVSSIDGLPSATQMISNSDWVMPWDQKGLWGEGPCNMNSLPRNPICRVSSVPSQHREGVDFVSLWAAPGVPRLPPTCLVVSTLYRDSRKTLWMAFQSNSHSLLQPETCQSILYNFCNWSCQTFYRASYTTDQLKRSPVFTSSVKLLGGNTKCWGVLFC